MTLVGTQPELKSIILNSHMDVVPVFEEYWTHRPFDADMDAEGRIIARGAQDMKSVGMQYLGALRYFVQKGVTFRRSIHVMFVPEEELGGDGGMADFVHTIDFRRLNAGFSLDEGENKTRKFMISTVKGTLSTLRTQMLMLNRGNLHYRL